MRRFLTTVAFAGALAFPLAASANEPTQEEVDRINAVLAEMQCEVDPEEIEVNDDGYELDDVFCADGQYDMDLDKDMQVTERRKE
jgi:hypothetical protein